MKQTHRSRCFWRNRHESLDIARRKALQDILGRISHKPKRPRGEAIRLENEFPGPNNPADGCKPENHHLPMRIKIHTQFSFHFYIFFFKFLKFSMSTCLKHDFEADSPKLMSRQNILNHLLGGSRHPKKYSKSQH